MWRISDPKDFFSRFPKLSQRKIQVTSPATGKYNCIAWAAGDPGMNWWPNPHGYWPRGVSRECTIKSFVEAFRTLGYKISKNPDHAPDKEKVAIFTLNGEPTHAARQLANGKWTSKCGKEVDLEHDLKDLEGPLYGVVALILERPK